METFGTEQRAKLANLKSRIKALLDNHLVLTTNSDRDKRHYKELREKTRQVEESIRDYDVIQAILETLQKEEHENTIGVYENMLSAILEDVLGTDRKVLMDLSVERGMPALDIYSQKEGGKPEDVFNANGGSVANILSAGLRSIALVRSQKRRFMILDEGDCWLKGDYIPRFGRVIQQLSERLGIQIIMISHHAEENFVDIPNKLLISKDSKGVLNAEWKTNFGNLPPEWNEDDEGIRSIFLENFQSHKHTYIPLGKNVTLITGDNDIGKSVIVNALRNVFYGESNDTVINHDATETRVSIEFSHGRMLTWRRKAKGKPKVSYMLTDSKHNKDKPLHYFEGAKEVPEWVKEEFGITLIDEELDVQLGHQKKPVFLLDESASKKAKSLSVGSDVNYIYKMMKLAKDELKENKAFVKNAEIELDNLYKRIELSGNLEKIEKARLESTLKEIEEQETELIKLETIESNIAKLKAEIAKQAVFKKIPMAKEGDISPIIEKLENNLKLRLVLQQYLNKTMELIILNKLSNRNVVPTIDLRVLSENEIGKVIYLFKNLLNQMKIINCLSQIKETSKGGIVINDDLIKTITLFKTYLKELNRLSSFGKLKAVQEKKVEITLFTELNEVIIKCKDYLKEESQLITFKQSLNEITHEMKVLLDGFSNIPHVCPVCMQAVKDNTKLNLSVLGD